MVQSQRCNRMGRSQAWCRIHNYPSIRHCIDRSQNSFRISPGGDDQEIDDQAAAKKDGRKNGIFHARHWENHVPTNCTEYCDKDKLEEEREPHFSGKIGRVRLSDPKQGFARVEPGLYSSAQMIGRQGNVLHNHDWVLTYTLRSANYQIKMPFIWSQH